jgi:F-type H+-transporting ATPase subunit delta
VTSSKVARRYAEALVTLAAEQDQLESWGAELERLTQAVSSPELMARLTSPELPDEQRLEAMTLVASSLELSFPLRSFAVVVARHHRLADLEAISQAYTDLLDRRLARVRAKFTFAMQPTDSDLKAVQALAENLLSSAPAERRLAPQVRAKLQIIPAIHVDPALIGGFVIEIEGRTYDASVATQLARMQLRLSE